MPDKPITVYNGRSASAEIREILEAEDIRFFASDNISGVLDDTLRERLVDELEDKFKGVLESLVIDVDNDPNSQDTPRRLAKMYVHELMKGRYYPAPAVTGFPNTGEDKMEGMLVIRAEIRSMCSHHHQPVKGICYIGILPGDMVIGLSKYARIAQHEARRGTLQEELCQRIMKKVQTHAHCRDVAVHIAATHGCMENRGVSAHSSLTQTTALSGQFFKDDVKSEFLNNVMMQMRLNGDHA